MFSYQCVLYKFKAIHHDKSFMIMWYSLDRKGRVCNDQIMKWSMIKLLWFWISSKPDYIYPNSLMMIFFFIRITRSKSKYFWLYPDHILSWFKSLWPSDAIWWHGIGSTLGQVMACYLTAPSHYLYQCWAIISKIPWHSSEDIVTRRSEDTYQ